LKIIPVHYSLALLSVTVLESLSVGLEVYNEESGGRMLQFSAEWNEIDYIYTVG